MNTLNVVEAVFFAALEKSTPEARAAYLDEACHGDANLRRCVERLLDAHPKVEGFLQSPAPGLAATVDEPPSIVEKPGTVIGPFKLLQQLGEGGFGVVFLAEQERPVRRKVALKIIKPGMDSQQVIARFEAERQALAMMDHPNIARVLDAGTTAAGRPYFVMELVKGVPITQFCDDNRLTPRERLELFVPVCQALQHAHQKGIIHRDIKPSNVLVTMYDDKPVPKVIDFGVAKAIEQRLTEQTLFTRIGQVVGTLEYMSPEQASLNALDVDTRSDVYALGVLLYELLTGSTPLNKERLQGMAFLEMLRLIREEEPPRPSTRLSQSGGGLPLLAAYRKIESQKLPKLVRGELDWIAMKALEKDRGRRYATANDLAADVQRYLKDEAVEACPPSAGYRLRKFARKNRKALVLAGAFALLLVIGTVMSSWQAVRATYAEMEETTLRTVAAQAEQQAKDDRDNALAAGRQATEAADTARTEVTNAQAARDELRGTLYAAHMNLVQAAWDTDNLVRVHELLEQHRPAPSEPDDRGFEWRYWQRQCHAELSTVELSQPLGQRAVFSRDGEQIACLISTADSTVARVWDTATGKETHAFPVAQTARGFRANLGFSPDGTRLVVARTRIGPGLVPSPNAHGEEIKVWDVSTGKGLCTIAAEFFYSFEGLPLSPDGKRVACQTIERDADKKITGYPLKVWDTATGMELLAIHLSQESWSPVFSPDGKYLAAAPKAGAAGEPPDIVVQLWDATTGKEHAAIKRTGTSVHYLAFSPDGTRLATLSGFSPGDRSRDAGLWDVATGKQLLTFQEVPRDVSSVVFSPDGKFVAWWYGVTSNTSSPTIRVWDTATGRVRLTLKGHTRGVECVAFSPDGTRLHSAAAGGTLKTWAIPPADIKSDPPAFLDVRRAGNVAVSPDGTRYTMPSTAQGEEHLLRVLDAVTRKELFIFREHKGAVQNVNFSPDSKRIASVAVLEDVDRTVEVEVWDAATGKVALALKLVDFGVRQVTAAPPPDSGLDPRTTLAGVPQAVFSPDGTHIALNQGTAVGEKGNRTGLMKLWDVAREKEVFATDKATGFPSDVHFSPDGKCLLASGGTPFKIKVLDAATYRELVTLEGEGGAPVDIPGPPAPGSGPLGNLVFSRDGTRVANIYRLRLTQPRDGNPPILACLNVWDVATGRQLITVPGYATASSIALSPDGRRLASVSNTNDDPAASGRVTVRDAATGKPLLTLQGHTGRVVGVAFSPDGRRIASIAVPPGFPPRQAEVRVWDAATGHELLTLTGVSGLRVSKLSFSPDGSRLVAAGWPVMSDSDALVAWDATPLPEPAPPVEKIKETIPAWGDVIDPAGDCTVRAADGKLTIAVPGTDHDLTRDDRSAPRLLQAVEGDFTFQVKVTGDFDPSKAGFNGAGLLLWIDHENYLRLERNVWFDVPTGKFVGYAPLFEYWRNGKRMRMNPLGTLEPFFKGRSTYLRLQRRVGNLVASVSHDGTEWISLPPLRIDLPKTVRVGVDAVSTSERPFVVEFSELRLTKK
jgi:WD40 repeat protein/serine/threonine protein kinase